MHAENRRLRRIDDWRTKERAEYSSITDGKSSTIHVFNRQRTFFRLIMNRKERYFILNVDRCLLLFLRIHRLLVRYPQSSSFQHFEAQARLDPKSISNQIGSHRLVYQ